MTDDTLRNDTIITDILDNDISIALNFLFCQIKVVAVMSLIKIPKIYRIIPLIYLHP